MNSSSEAYLDIETTGLSSTHCETTVVGIHLNNRTKARCIQLIGREISADSILDALKGIELIYTYNGSRFDLPFIYNQFGVDLAKVFDHRDLMYDCWRCNLYGGLKAVERQLGIKRKVGDIDGYQAIRLWWRYVDHFDLDALKTLLKYNREDVLNLKVLKEKLL